MLESGLYFTLGFMCSALIGLLVAPAIWRRAVALTRKRIESSVPLTLNEIQADKDQLRAEFAMSTRRLEVSLEKLKERAAEQLIDINRRRDEMLELEEQEVEKSGRIMELEAQSAELRSEVNSREERLSQTSSTLTTVQNKLEERAQSYEELDQKYQTAVDDFDGQKIEMVARETRLDTIQDEARTSREKLKSQNTSQLEMQKHVKSLAASLKKQERHNLELSEKLARFQSQSADMESRLDRRDADIARLRGKSGDTSSHTIDLEKALDTSQAEKLELETELATLTLRMEASLGGGGKTSKLSKTSDDNEAKNIKKSLTKTEEERDALRIELSAIQLATEGDWDMERRENALVRERINDLAAKVTAMTASIEGPDSPINAALAKKKKRNTRSPNSTTKSGKSTKKNSEQADSKVISLADRIHALQDAAEQA
ncbi:MAG: hypothetical protein V3V04_02215 [Rhizobiaceae bacterium]